MENTKKKNLAVFFPGIGYTADKPLLYYGQKLARQADYLVKVLNYGGFPPKIEGDKARMMRSFEIALEQAEEMLGDLDLTFFDDIVFIGKSIGTIAAAAIAAKSPAKERIRFVLYTPLEETFRFPLGEAAAFTGTADQWTGKEKSRIPELCRERQIPCTIIEGGNHSLECGDPAVDVKNLERILDETGAFLERMRSAGPALDLICAGTALIDSVIKGFDPEPVSARGFHADSISLAVGGEAVNQSVTASKLGLRAGIVCHLADDGAASLLKTALAEAGVDTNFAVKSESATPVTTMFVADDGSRKSITTNAHRINHHPERDLTFLSRTKALAIGSLFRAPFNERGVIEPILREAKKQGVTVFADTKIPNGPTVLPADIADLMPLIDYIFPNEDEAAFLSGESDPDAMADYFLGLGIPHVIIKLGEKGCLYCDKKGGFRLRTPAFPVKAVDATGAGDNFIAAFITALLTGGADGAADTVEGMTDILRFATACAAVSTTKVGATTAVVDRAQVERFLEDNAE